jgi:uncharacterized membrane protein
MWFWGIYGLIIAYVLANAAQILYGMREALKEFSARPDLKANCKILLAAVAAAVRRLCYFKLIQHGRLSLT